MLEMRNIRVAGKRSSVRLEPAMWAALEEMCRREGLTQDQVADQANAARGTLRLTSALRAHILGYYRKLAVGAASRLAVPRRQVAVAAAASGGLSINRKEGGMGQVIYLSTRQDPAAEAAERESVARAIRAALTYFLRDAEAVGLHATAKALGLALYGTEFDIALPGRRPR